MSNKDLLSYLNKLKDNNEKIVPPQHIEADDISKNKIQGDTKVDIEIKETDEKEINEKLKEKVEEKKISFTIKSNFIKESLIKSIADHYELKSIKIFNELENSYKGDILYHTMIAWDLKDIHNEYDYVKKFMFIRFLYCEKYFSKNKILIYSIKDNNILEYDFSLEKELYNEFRRRLGIK